MIGFGSLKLGNWINIDTPFIRKNYDHNSSLQTVIRSSSQESGFTKFNPHEYYRGCKVSNLIGFGTYNSITKTITTLLDFSNLAYYPFNAPNTINPGGKDIQRSLSDSSRFKNITLECDGLKFTDKNGIFYKNGSQFFGITFSEKGYRPCIGGDKFYPFAWNKSFYLSGSCDIKIYNNKIVKDGITTNFSHNQYYIYTMIQAKGGNGGRAVDKGWWTNGCGAEGASGSFILLRHHIIGSNFIHIVNSEGTSKIYHNDVLMITVGKGGNASGQYWGERGIVTNNGLINTEIVMQERGRGVEKFGIGGNITENPIAETYLTKAASDDTSVYFDGYGISNTFPSRLARGGNRGGSGKGENGTYGSGGGGGGYDSSFWGVDYYSGGTGGPSYIVIGY